MAYKTCILTALREEVHNDINMHGGLNNTGPQDRSVLEEVGSILDIMGHTEFTFSEEKYSKEKDVLTRISRSEGILFQEEGKDWESA